MVKIDKKQAVLNAALDLFVKQGFHSTSTASIAKTAGVATGTLFHHFPAKDAILAALFINIKAEFAEHITRKANFNGDLKHDAQVLWQNALDWAIANHTKQQFFLQYSLSSDLPAPARHHAMTDILKFIVDLIEQGQQQGVIVTFPIKLMLENCHGQYLAAIRFFSDNPELGQHPQYRQASFELFWRAIAC